MEIEMEVVVAKLNELAAKLVQAEVIIEVQAAHIADLEAPDGDPDVDSDHG